MGWACQAVPPHATDGQPMSKWALIVQAAGFRLHRIASAGLSVPSPVRASSVTSWPRLDLSPAACSRRSRVPLRCDRTWCVVRPGWCVDRPRPAAGCRLPTRDRGDILRVEPRSHMAFTFELYPTPELSATLRRAHSLRETRVRAKPELRPRARRALFWGMTRRSRVVYVGQKFVRRVPPNDAWSRWRCTARCARSAGGCSDDHECPQNVTRDRSRPLRRAPRCRWSRSRLRVCPPPPPPLFFPPPAASSLTELGELSADPFRGRVSEHAATIRAM